MVKKALFSGISIHRGQFFLIFFLIFNSLTWFFTILYVVRDQPLFWLLPAATLISLLIGPLIAEKISRKRFLFSWALVGVISSLSSMILLSKFGEYGTATSLILWGFAFGIGFPSCLALMPILSRVEERGRVGGIIFFITYATLPLFMLTIGNLDIVSSLFLLTLWRCFSLILFLLKVDMGVSLKPVSYSSILSHRQFLLYFLPFLVFCIINELERPIFKESLGVGLWETLGTVEYSVGSFLCLISGWLLDFKGRRWTVLIGFVTLGLGYAALGFFPFTSTAQAFFILTDSIAWGVFTVTFGLVIWGDIASNQRAEKFYGLGSVPSSLALVLAMLSLPLLKTLDVGKAFPLASFFLFLAVIPIFFAPELLPEKVVKERELKKYMEEAKKVAGKS